MARARRFDWDNLRLRIASGVILGTAAVAITLWAGDAAFMVMVAVAASVMSVEWAVMAAKANPSRLAVVMTAAVLGAIFLVYIHHPVAAWAMVLFGTLAVAAASHGVTARRADAAYGVLYVAPACMAIVWLHGTRQGAGWTVMLLATTWAADVFAFAVGNALKGPKLWPRYSPNKTWSGFFGGLVGAAAVAVAVASSPSLHLALVGAALIGLAAGLATMGGDLWESMLKRRFGVKDSGDLIPGHGGLLDRVDGLMFGAIVFAAARMIVRLGWAH